MHPLAQSATTISPLIGALGPQNVYGSSLVSFIDIANTTNAGKLDPRHYEMAHECGDGFRMLGIDRPFNEFIERVKPLEHNDREGFADARMSLFNATRAPLTHRMFSLAMQIQSASPAYPVTLKIDEAFSPQMLADMQDYGIVSDVAVHALAYSLSEYLKSAVSIAEKTLEDVEPIGDSAALHQRFAIVSMFGAIASAIFRTADPTYSSLSCLGEHCSQIISDSLRIMHPTHCLIVATLGLIVSTAQFRKEGKVMLEQLGSKSKEDVDRWLRDTADSIDGYNMLIDAAARKYGNNGFLDSSDPSFSPIEK